MSTFWRRVAGEYEQKKSIEERARDAGVPVIPPLPPRNPDPNPVVAICGECGLEIRQMMHYSCPNARCPVQVKPGL